MAAKAVAIGRALLSFRSSASPSSYLIISKRTFSSSSYIARAPPLPGFRRAVRPAVCLSHSLQVAAVRLNLIGCPVNRSGGSNFSDREMAPLFDYEHWLIVMDKPGGEGATKKQMIDFYVETLAKVLGSEEEAKKKIYNVSCERYFGFGCEIDEETSNKLEGLPGVLFVLPDTYVDAENKDYGVTTKQPLKLGRRREEEIKTRRRRRKESAMPLFTSSSRHFLPISSRFAFHRGIMDSGMMHVSRHPSNEWKNRMSTYQRKPFSLILPRSIDSMYNNNNNIGVEMESSRYEILRSGMLLLKNYLTLSQQVEIVNRCEELGVGPGGFYDTRPGGAKFTRMLMCLGRNWDPQTKYKKRIRKCDGSEAPPIPHELIRMVKDVLQASQSLLINSEHELPLMSPNICLINFYTTSGRLALHQDRSESSYSLRVGLPVVSISIGDSADFLYGSGDVDKASKTLLESGDVLIFGGKSRLIYHGVKTIIPNSAPRPLLEQTMLRPGRLNLTFREF